jgi:serine/threonine-protein phosphatase 2A activator
MNKYNLQFYFGKIIAPMNEKETFSVTTSFPGKKKQNATISSNLPRDSYTDIEQTEGPSRKLFEREHLSDWLHSKAYSELYNFIEKMAMSCTGKPLSIKIQPSETVLQILKIIQEISELIQQFPPEGNTSRYGNLVFRTFFAKVCENSDEYMISILKTKEEKPEHWKVVELSSYFKESFGNNTRIDYGNF